MGKSFVYLDEAGKSVFAEPSLKRRGDDDRHGCVCVGEGIGWLRAGGRESARGRVLGGVQTWMQ